jgi:hypothetical protein
LIVVRQKLKLSTLLVEAEEKFTSL